MTPLGRFLGRSVKRLIRGARPAGPAEVDAPEDVAIGLYLAGGRKPWSKGYTQYKDRFVRGALADPVLLDAFLVRLVLLPVLLRLTGRAAWAVPGWLERLLPKVSFAH